MTKQDLLESIIIDLGANFKDDEEVLSALLNEVVNDALFISNRDSLAVASEEDLQQQLDYLSSNIRRAVKSIYLQRGAEDVTSQSLSGLSSVYDKTIQTMKDDIIKSGKRIIR